jgi:putative redox protein
MEIGFPGGAKVEVAYNGHTVVTDQPAKAGGADSAPSPFDLFLISIGACAGYYALSFCNGRKINTDGMALTLDTEYDEAKKLVSKVSIRIRLPAGFPPEYRDAMVRAVDSCTVKRHMQNPPEFQVETL